MKPRYQTIAGLAFVGIGVVLLFGCHDTSTRQGGKVNEEFLLASAPTGAGGIVQVRATLEASPEPSDVVVTGRIGGLWQPTWDPDRAAFMVSDLSFKEDDDQRDGAPKHDADSCPFCRKKRETQKAGLARIEIVGQNGEVPPVDARELLGLAEGQTIVLQGKGQIDGLGSFVVRTTGIYVQP